MRNMPAINRRRHSRHSPASTVTGTFRSKHMLGKRLRARSRSREPADFFKRLNFIDPVTRRHLQGRKVMTALLSPFTSVEHWARQSWKCSEKRHMEACFYGNMLPPLKRTTLRKQLLSIILRIKMKYVEIWRRSGFKAAIPCTNSLV